MVTVALGGDAESAEAEATPTSEVSRIPDLCGTTSWDRSGWYRERVDQVREHVDQLRQRVDQLRQRVDGHRGQQNPRRAYTPPPSPRSSQPPSQGGSM
eukprot:5196440-Prorocentrum_lima.AAC.1